MEENNSDQKENEFSNGEIKEELTKKDVSSDNSEAVDDQVVKKKNFPMIMIEKSNFPIIVGLIGVILTGIISGYFLARRGISLPQGRIGGRPKKIVGAKDVSVFKDQAVGVIEKGGIDGEGTHKLIREGGPDQTAYLTSSVVDLDEFVGIKVKVWGETFAAQKAGWLMDVGRVEILE